MSSLLTNTSAIVALRTLRVIHDDFQETRSAIATGKEVATARDDAALWAISKVMDGYVAGFRAIDDNLGLGHATVSVSREAAETATALLTRMKTVIVAANERNMDRAKLQAELLSLREQIDSVVGTAQFNGLNLLENDSVADGAVAGNTREGRISVLASLQLDAHGRAKASRIEVQRFDLGVYAGVGATATTAAGANGGAALGAGETRVFFDVGASLADNQKFTNGTTLLGLGTDLRQLSYQRRVGESDAQVAQAIAERLNFVVDEREIALSFAAEGERVTVTNLGDATLTMATGDARIDDILATDRAHGRLSLVNFFDVTTDAGARAALAAIEPLIQVAIDTAAALGAGERQIEAQRDFMAVLTDSFVSGIGTLVDTDMERVSARLQSLQVQEQLSLQSLSIANAAPQQLLSLFR